MAAQKYTGSGAVPICHIAGAGPCEPADLAYLKARLASEEGGKDYVIAADRGLSCLEEAGIQAHMAVGDWDTLGAPPAHGNLVALPQVKDVTDTFAAMEKAVALGHTEFFFYGCLGGRVEHTVANIQHLAWLAQRDMTGVLIGGGQAVTAMKGPGRLAFSHWEQRLQTGTLLDSLPIDRRPGRFLSVFSYGDRTEGVYLTGLKYPLTDAVLTSGFPLGVSNEFLDGPACIKWEKGILLLVLPLAA